MAVSPAVSVVYPYHLAWGAASSVLRRAEAAGLRSVWVFENPRDRGAFVMLGAILGATQRISVGVGVVTTYVRLPETTAMEAFQARAIGGDRVVVGVGAGSATAAESIGATFEPPLTAIRALVERVRSFRPLTDGAADPEEPPPVYIAATGPRMLALAGELADGVILSMHAPPAFLAETVATVRGEASKGGRRRPPPTIAYRHIAVAGEHAAAVNQGKTELAPTLVRIGEAPVFRRMMAAGGGEFAADLARAVPALRRGDSPSDAISDELALALCTCGTAETVARDLHQLARDTGLDEIAMFSARMETEDYGSIFKALQGRAVQDRR